MSSGASAADTEPVEPLLPAEPGDFEEPEVLESSPTSAAPSSLRTAVIAIVVAGVVGLVAVLGFGGAAGRSAPEPSPTFVPTPSAISWPSPRAPSPTPTRPPVFSSSGFLADLDIVVFARSNRAVYRIDTRAGQVTRTRVSELSPSGPVIFLPTSDRVIIRPLDEGAGFALIDGQPARPLTGLLISGGEFFPGVADRVWSITALSPSRYVANLTDPAGSRIYARVNVTGTGTFGADGAGGLFYTDVGGTYQATPSGLRRVTSGRVVATSRNRFLAVECDERYACRTLLYDRRTDTRRRVGGLRLEPGPPGVLSPDGRHLALRNWGESSGPSLSVVEVGTGRQIASFSMEDADISIDPSAIWLPDGRLLWLRNSRLAVFDPRTRQTSASSLRLAPLVQLAVRPPAG